MLIRKQPFWLWLLPAATIILLAGCAPQAATPLPTRPPAPTFTPTAVVEVQPVDPETAATAQALAEAQQVQPAQPAEQAPAADQPPAEQPAEAAPAAPTDTPVPTPTPAAEVVISSLVNVRGGPGTNYTILGGANPGERYPVTGKNTDGTWWQIDYQGQAGWVLGELVTSQNTEGVAVAQNIPAPPPTQAPPPAPPTQAPTPAPAVVAPAPAPAADTFPYLLVDSFVRCDPNQATTYFKGYVRNKDNSPKNAVCVHIAFFGPRNTKCSGCDGVGDGNWGFSPFGGPAPAGTPVEIFVVQCPPGGMPTGGQTEGSGFGDLTPLSAKWTRVISQSEQCAEITFVQK